MHIKDKILLNYDGLIKEGPISIVVFGDSITHGALKTDEYNYETVYWNILRKKILNVRNYVPVNIINAGIAGINAKNSIDRMDRQVLCHNPDLIIICFGLNDVMGTLDEYISSLETIFKKSLDSGADVIFMTPNMLNEYVADHTDVKNIEYAKLTAECQNNGKMDMFIESAMNLAKEMNVKVCDCYGEWKRLNKTEDTTKLLINGINHPTPKMHELFAEKLFNIIFESK